LKVPIETRGWHCERLKHECHGCHVLESRSTSTKFAARLAIATCFHRICLPQVHPAPLGLVSLVIFATMQARAAMTTVAMARTPVTMKTTSGKAKTLSGKAKTVSGGGSNGNGPAGLSPGQECELPRISDA
jgi:hypothetical protein